MFLNFEQFNLPTFKLVMKRELLIEQKCCKDYFVCKFDSNSGLGVTCMFKMEAKHYVPMDEWHKMELTGLIAYGEQNTNIWQNLETIESLFDLWYYFKSSNLPSASLVKHKQGLHLNIKVLSWFHNFSHPKVLTYLLITHFPWSHFSIIFSEATVRTFLDSIDIIFPVIFQTRFHDFFSRPYTIFLSRALFPGVNIFQYVYRTKEIQLHRFYFNYKHKVTSWDLLYFKFQPTAKLHCCYQTASQTLLGKIFRFLYYHHWNVISVVNSICFWI